MGMTDGVIQGLALGDAAEMSGEDVRIIAVCLAHAAHPDAIYNNWAFDKWNRFVPKSQLPPEAAKVLVNQAISKEILLDDCCMRVFGIDSSCLPAAVKTAESEWLEENPHGQQVPVPSGCSAPVILIGLITSLLVSCAVIGGV